MTTTPTAPQTPGTTPEPVLVWMSVLAGLQIFFSGGTGVGLLNDSDLIAGIMAIGALAVASSQVGLQFYVRGKVTPNESVVARIDQASGQVVTGLAAPPAGVEVATVETAAPVDFGNDGADAGRHRAPSTYSGGSKTDATWHP